MRCVVKIAVFYLQDIRFPVVFIPNMYLNFCTRTRSKLKATFRLAKNKMLSKTLSGLI